MRFFLELIRDHARNFSFHSWTHSQTHCTLHTSVHCTNTHSIWSTENWPRRFVCFICESFMTLSLSIFSAAFSLSPSSLSVRSFSACVCAQTFLLVCSLILLTTIYYLCIVHLRPLSLSPSLSVSHAHAFGRRFYRKTSNKARHSECLLYCRSLYGAVRQWLQCFKRIGQWATTTTCSCQMEWFVSPMVVDQTMTACVSHSNYFSSEKLYKFTEK